MPRIERFVFNLCCCLYFLKKRKDPKHTRVFLTGQNRTKHSHFREVLFFKLRTTSNKQTNKNTQLLDLVSDIFLKRRKKKEKGDWMFEIQGYKDLYSPMTLKCAQEYVLVTFQSYNYSLRSFTQKGTCIHIQLVTMYTGKNEQGHS